MGLLKAILSDTYTLFGVANKLVYPATVPINRLYATGYVQQYDKREKKARKLEAAAAAEPHHFQPRSNKWKELKEKYDQEVAAKAQEIINVTLLDGKVVEGFSWDLTPLNVARGISHALASEVHLAKINDHLWDVERPLETDCKIQLLKFDSPDAKAAFWTTAAFIVAEALERLYCKDDGSVVCNVGSTQTGFFADIYRQKTINRNDIAAIDEQITKIRSGENSKVDRIVASKSDANELFAYNPFKLKTINDRLSDGVPIYRCGSFIEIVDTPLIRHNKKVKVIKILKMESVLCNSEPVQRIHGVAFPSLKEMKDHLKQKKLT